MSQSMESYPVELVSLPADTRLHVIERRTGRIVLEIDAAGWRARSVILFALFWNLITIGVSAMFLSDLSDMPWLVIFQLPFWGIGLAFAVWATRTALTRTFLFVDRDQAATQTSLLGLKTTRSISVSLVSRAFLEESYRMNDQPVHRIVIEGVGDRLTFGTPLLPVEKQWIVEAVNTLLVPGATSEQGGASVSNSTAGGSPDRLLVMATRARPAAAMAPAQLPPDSCVRVDDDSRERFRISVPAVPRGTIRTVGILVLGGVLAVMAVVTALVYRPDVSDLFSLAFVAFMPAIFAYLLHFVVAGRITTTVDTASEDNPSITVRCPWWPLDGKQTLPLASIEKVTAGDPDQPETLGSHIAVVMANGETMAMTSFHDRRTDQEAAGLIQWHLERIGHASAH